MPEYYINASSCFLEEKEHKLRYRRIIFRHGAHRRRWQQPKDMVGKQLAVLHSCFSSTHEKKLVLLIVLFLSQTR